jgi:hypothetical protein
MINLSQTFKSGPQVQTVVTDPGVAWIKDTSWVVDAPPDDAAQPEPEATWPNSRVRTGLCGAVSPRAIALPGGGYRLYSTQILPRAGAAAGAVDYGNATSRILSAFSADGVSWRPEAGVRLSAAKGGAGEYRVVSSEVVPVLDGSGRLRMYYECAAGPLTVPNSIRSAISEDGGLEWTPEPGVRWAKGDGNYMAPRILFLADGRIRLYCCERGRGIISAVSEGDGLKFTEEPDVRIAAGGSFDTQVAFAPEIMHLAGGGYLAYYAGYSAPNRAQILRATSDDGLVWRKEAHPPIAPDGTGLDAVKCSEMCILQLPAATGRGIRYRILYEGCDGTAPGERGVWRVLGATSGV